MSKLLRADFFRLFKSKIFWLGVLFMAGLAGFAVFTRWSDMQAFPEYYRSSDAFIFSGGMYVGIVIAVFTGIFIGSDYSDGTIRNKHIIGHSRMKIYLSNLIICFFASVVMYSVFLIVILGSSALNIIGGIEMSSDTLAKLLVTYLFSIWAISAMCLFLAMLIHKKTAGVVTAMIFSIFMIIAANAIDYRLSAKEYTEPYSVTVTTADGTEKDIEQPSVKNPKYLTGTKKEIFQFLHDTLPVDQIMQAYYELNFEKHFPLRSLCIIAIVTGAGILLFRKKDLT